MLDWLKRLGSTPDREAVADATPASRPSRSAGKYRFLHKYLNERYANTVVLTFGQIEDLLGFPLPELARNSQEWWTGAPLTTEPSQSDAWVLAHRTATPNLAAQNVVFERGI